MKFDSEKHRIILRLAISTGVLLLCLLAIVWMQREARRHQDDRDLRADPERRAWIATQESWVAEAPSSRALWSGTVTRFISGNSDNLRAIELKDTACLLGQPGSHDRGTTVYVSLARLNDTRLPAFGEGTQWLILVERDEEDRSAAVAARPL